MLYFFLPWDYFYSNNWRYDVDIKESKIFERGRFILAVTYIYFSKYLYLRECYIFFWTCDYFYSNDWLCDVDIKENKIFKYGGDLY
jgi:hypothetical protein